jgi:hypothetical protein
MNAPRWYENHAHHIFKIFRCLIPFFLCFPFLYLKPSVFVTFQTNSAPTVERAVGADAVQSPAFLNICLNAIGEANNFNGYAANAIQTNLSSIRANQASASVGILAKLIGDATSAPCGFFSTVAGICKDTDLSSP